MGGANDIGGGGLRDCPKRFGGGVRNGEWRDAKRWAVVSGPHFEYSEFTSGRSDNTCESTEDVDFYSQRIKQDL